jgi:hypothetical protein
MDLFSCSSNTKTRRNRFQRHQFYHHIIANAQFCANQNIDLLVVVVSKPGNYKNRDTIRRTWGSGKGLGVYSSINVKFLFLLDVDERLDRQIALENELFSDIIQVELPQQYTLVTHRILSLLEWSFRFCRHAKYVFKTDDDIFINIFLLLKYLRPFLDQTVSNSFRTNEMHLHGYVHRGAVVFRKTADGVNARYIVTRDEFPCDFYPDFLSGFGYAMSKKARDALVYTAYQDPQPFRISDVYLT